MSKNTELHERICKLFLAAQLQEGFRQAVCETCDSGRIEPFLMVLKVIRDNNLIRFSSVKRSVGCWVGLTSDGIHDIERISEKTLELMIECFENPTVIDEYLKSEDSMKLYVALWATACREMHTTEQKIAEILEHGTAHQAMTAGVFTKCTMEASISQRMPINAIMLRHDELDVVATWIAGIEGAKFRRSDIYGGWSNEEARKLYGILNEMLGKLPKDGLKFNPCVFPWNSEELTRSDIIERLCVIAADLDDDELIDETCVKIPLMVGGRFMSKCAVCVKMLLCNPRTEIQLDTLVSLAADREENTRIEVFRLLNKLEIQGKHFRMLEDMLKYKAADRRQKIIDILLRQNETDLFKCIERLASDGKEEKRTAALDMIIRIIEDDKGIYPNEAKQRYRGLANKIENPTSKEKILINRILPVRDATDAADELHEDTDDFTPEIDMAYIEQCKATFIKTFPTTRLFGNKPDKKLGLMRILNDFDSFIEEHKNDEYLDSDSGEKRLLTDYDGLFGFRVKENSDGTIRIAFKELWDEFYRAHIGNEDMLFDLIMFLFGAADQTNTTKFVKGFFGEEFCEKPELMHIPVIKNVLFDYYFHSYAIKPRLEEACALAYHIAYEADDDELHDEVLQLHCIDAWELEYLRRGLVSQLSHQKRIKVVTPMNDSKVNRLMRWLNASLSITAEHLMDVLSLEYKMACRFGFFELKEPVDLHNIDVMTNTYSPFTSEMLILTAYQKRISIGFACRMLVKQSHMLSRLTEVLSYKYLGCSKTFSHYKIPMNVDATIKRILGMDSKEKLSEHEFTDEDNCRIDFAVGIAQKVVDAVLKVELARGDTETEFSRKIVDLCRIFGVENLVHILAALGTDTISRTHLYWSNRFVSKQQSLSYLLGICEPAPGDSAEKLRELIKKTDITEKRLIEAALVSNSWLDIVEEYLGWKGFKSACYYFIAHMDALLDNKTQAIIAKYTPLTAEELSGGAFDIEWFKDALETVGEKRFDLIYEAAKYISDSSKHIRARKYADAVMGKLIKADAVKQIEEKRNKDTLMAYGLIPLDGEKDMAERYLFIQRFRKESKKFGSQRRLSEGMAADCALRNLAINAGFADVSRLKLRMETVLFEEVKPLLEWNEIDDIRLKITIDENGKANILCEKGGKALKNVPAKYNKNERVMEFTEVKKRLIEQYLRTKQMLEEAMEDETEFTEGELAVLCQNPVIKPIIINLVYKSGDRLGFLNGDALVDYAGREVKLAENAAIKVAHPFDLYKDGHWHDYQKQFFDKRIAQPFRQVFRGLYLMTDEETTAFRSMRYEGNQIQPLKAKACLKDRRWVVGEDAGLQKVYHKENIVATMFALADWFTPADIEAPTLEWVEFFDRKTGKAIRIEEIPDIIFSEVMRDVDLAVSVAHAGGVDSEASHSTVEMRKAIIEFVLPLFKLQNVRLEGFHAFIKGKRADYSIHLGSGVVHIQGGPMVNILPVHSQHRGRLFLPFIDDDPKKAQIISEILLLAEDIKIKDPSILGQIQ